MQSSVTDYVVSNATPELSDLLIDAYSMLLSIEVVGFEDMCDELLLNSGVAESFTIVTSIHDFIQNTIKSLLLEYGLTISEEASLADTLVILEASIDIQTYDNIVDILRVIESDFNTEEKVAELYSYVSTETPSFFLMNIMNANPAIIDRIKELTNMWSEEVYLGNKDDETKVTKLKQFCNYILSTNIGIVQTLIDGIAVGYPFETYLKQNGPILEMLTADAAAKELIATALISSDATDNIIGHIRNHLHNYVSDLTKVTAIDKIANDLLIGFNR